MINRYLLAPLFEGWQETMIWSFLQGHMGFALTDNEAAPTAAQIVVGDFCFFAGQPNADLAKQAAAPLLIPQDDAWCQVIESVWGDRVQKAQRYAIQKEPGVFDTEKLGMYAASLSDGYTICRIDEEIYRQALKSDWSRDLCSQFADYSDYHTRGLGVAVLHEGQLVAGASSYSIYDDGIEIEIDTKQEHRQKGLATACGASLILECLKRGWYPSWDAHDLRSVALAEKLGYHLEGAYPVYNKK